MWKQQYITWDYVRKKETSMLSMRWESYISVAEMFPVIGKRQWNI